MAGAALMVITTKPRGVQTSKLISVLVLNKIYPTINSNIRSTLYRFQVLS
jgi:hypothetical protein